MWQHLPQCLLSRGRLLLALTLQNFPQLPAVCGYEILLQRAGFELHHNVVVIGGDQAVAPLKVCDLHRFCVREMEGFLDTLRFVILQIENDLSLAVVDDALAKTPCSLHHSAE